MMRRHTVVTLAMAVSLAFASTAHVARGDSTSPPATVTKKRPAAPQARRKPTPKQVNAARKGTKPAAAEAAHSPAPAKPGAAAGHEVVEHESRIEFDERMVRGQTAAGAIFLFQRTPSELKSIVEIPTSFRDKTVEMLQPREERP